jgi:hypothetical protein
VQRAVLAAGPEVIVHMLTAIPDPVDPRHLARDMALTNRLRTQGTANLLAAADGARVIVQPGGLVLRLGHLYGPGSGLDPDGGGLTRRLRAGRLPLIGDGASLFSFIHAHDVATAILAAVEHPAARGP